MEGKLLLIGSCRRVKTGKVFAHFIYRPLIKNMKKNFHSDWLREMHFSGNTVQKRGNQCSKNVTYGYLELPIPREIPLKRQMKSNTE